MASRTAGLGEGSCSAIAALALLGIGVADRQPYRRAARIVGCAGHRRPYRRRRRHLDRRQSQPPNADTQRLQSPPQRTPSLLSTATFCSTRAGSAQVVDRIASAESRVQLDCRLRAGERGDALQARRRNRPGAGDRAAIRPGRLSDRAASPPAGDGRRLVRRDRRQRRDGPAAAVVANGDRLARLGERRMEGQRPSRAPTGPLLRCPPRKSRPPRVSCSLPSRAMTSSAVTSREPALGPRWRARRSRCSYARSSLVGPWTPTARAAACGASEPMRPPGRRPRLRRRRKRREQRRSRGRRLRHARRDRVGHGRRGLGDRQGRRSRQQHDEPRSDGELVRKVSTAPCSPWPGRSPS